MRTAFSSSQPEPSSSAAKPDQTKEAHVAHDLQNVVMDVFGFIIEGLNGAVQTLGRSETVTDQGTLGKQGPSVLEELDTLLHIFRCRVKNAVFHGFREQNVPQGKLCPIG